MTTTVRTKHFLEEARTKDYLPDVYFASMAGGLSMNRMPPFSLFCVAQMLRDPRIRFALWLIKGPILSRTKFEIECENRECREYIIDNLRRFWTTSASRALKALDWGYSCSEALYRVKDGRVHFDILKDLHSLDCRALTHKGRLVGGRLIRSRGGAGSSAESHGSSNTRIDLPFFKCFWHVHGRENHPFYGLSRLHGAYIPWMELWQDGGTRQARSLFYYKYAYDGGTIYHPVGSTPTYTTDSGVTIEISNKELARQMLERKRAGGTMTLPNKVDDRGQRVWEYIPPAANQPPTGLEEYLVSLKDEELEGIGIPPEVVRADGTGSYNGRMIPMMAFNSTLAELAFWLAFDFEGQILTPLVRHEYGDVPFSIRPTGLIEQAPSSQEEMENQPGVASQPEG